jgi:hypothetical protein
MQRKRFLQGLPDREIPEVRAYGRTIAETSPERVQDPETAEQMRRVAEAIRRVEAE